MIWLLIMAIREIVEGVRDFVARILIMAILVVGGSRVFVMFLYGARFAL